MGQPSGVPEVQNTPLEPGLELEASWLKTPFAGVAASEYSVALMLPRPFRPVLPRDSLSKLTMPANIGVAMEVPPNVKP
jgi:hypothetical protein